MKITVLSVGRLRAPYADDIAHYEKLIGHYAPIELIELREPEKLAKRVPEKAHLVLLDGGGKQYDSVAFSGFLEQRRASGLDLCFVVGGAYGIELERADDRLSLGPMTLPHQLARVVLLEQIYRGHAILAGAPYHH
ncbi:MAG: 23S rRNA (pseudouridine(1915)-N(3))-methyltransferase RlmH [Solirubrobacterales bacterium]|nr:23S rRNA (pseudouridine(1915)-N(3))-methyltransferase RlmH [Solirubrobacterales bacterium]